MMCLYFHRIHQNISLHVTGHLAINNSFIFARCREFDIMDSMVQKLEKYADNLENIVQHRTAELMDEKQKTDMLLHRMLPEWISALLAIICYAVSQAEPLCVRDKSQLNPIKVWWKCWTSHRCPLLYFITVNADLLHVGCVKLTAHCPVFYAVFQLRGGRTESWSHCASTDVS